MLTIMSNWEPPKHGGKDGKGRSKPTKVKLTEHERRQLNQGLIEFLILAVLLVLLAAA